MDILAEVAEEMDTAGEVLIPFIVPMDTVISLTTTEAEEIRNEAAVRTATSEDSEPVLLLTHPEGGSFGALQSMGSLGFGRSRTVNQEEGEIIDVDTVEQPIGTPTPSVRLSASEVDAMLKLLEAQGIMVAPTLAA